MSVLMRATLQSAKGCTDTSSTASVQTAKAYTDTHSTATLSSANAYTDQKFASLSLDFTGIRAEVNDRFEQQDKRISQVGAMGAAMANMTASAAG